MRKRAISFPDGTPYKPSDKCNPFAGRECNKMSCAACREHIAGELHDARRLLHVHGVLADDENEAAKRRIGRILEGRNV